jgi:hypothetical protein
MVSTMGARVIGFGMDLSISNGKACLYFIEP